jgi:hypothetical protein
MWYVDRCCARNPSAQLPLAGDMATGVRAAFSLLALDGAYAAVISACRSRDLSLASS